MMNQPINQKIKTGKLLVLLPVIAILFMSFSLKVENLDIKKEIAEILPVFDRPGSALGSSLNLSEIEKLKIVPVEQSGFQAKADTSDTNAEEVFLVVEQSPIPSTGDMASYHEAINSKKNYNKIANIKNASVTNLKEQNGKVFVQFIVQKDGNLRDVKVVKGMGAGFDEQAVRLVKEGPAWIAGRQRGKDVNVLMIVPVSFGNEEETETRKLSGTVLTDDGEPVIGANVIIKDTHTGTVTDKEGKFLLEVEPEHTELIFSFSGLETQILKIEDDSDLVVKMKGTPLYSSPMKSDDSNLSIRVAGKDIILEKDRPLFILDGKKITQKELNSVQPDDIESISVLKDNSAVTKYGEKGKNGVIIINTKNRIEVSKIGKWDIDKENPPLIYKDGIEIALEDIEKLDPETIESIDVLKGDSAREKYGEKGKNGVILIKMKQ